MFYPISLMENLNFKQNCIQCGNKTISRCTGCFRSLCGRCKTKRSKRIFLLNIVIPKGICKDCYELSLLYQTLKLAEDFTVFFSKLPNKIDEWKKYLD
jgi:hypothetical protein